MTDQTIDPHDEHVTDADEPVVDLDTRAEPDAEHETADDKYVRVIDGRPETLGFETKSGPSDE